MEWKIIAKDLKKKIRERWNFTLQISRIQKIQSAISNSIAGEKI